jgi:molybdopterin molybdotransferase
VEKQGIYYAEPVLGPSGLIRTLIEADALIEIDMNTEGLEKGESVTVIMMR